MADLKPKIGFQWNESFAISLEFGRSYIQHTLDVADCS